MTYTQQTWSDNDNAFPASASRFQHIEAGIAAIDTASSPVRIYAGLPGSATAPPNGTTHPYVFFQTDGASNLVDILFGNIL